MSQQDENTNIPAEQADTTTPEYTPDDPHMPDAEIHTKSTTLADPTSSEVFSVSRDTLNYVVIAALFLGLGAFLGISFGGSSVDREELRDVVEEVVRENNAEQLAQLEEILLSVASGGDLDPESLSAMIQSAVEEATAEQVEYYEDDDPYLGPEDAPVVMVEFSDFLCSFCGRHFQGTLTPLLEEYDGLIRYVYRDFPGVGGQNAVVSAIAAECADDQGEFWAYHEALFSNQQALGDSGALEDNLISFARDLDLDVETFTTCLQEQEHYVDVIRDLQDAQSFGARGTPAFMINGQFVSGAQPYEIFASIIDAELAEAGIIREGSSG